MTEPRQRGAGTAEHNISKIITRYLLSLAERGLDRVEVEKRLRRMLVLAVARVHDVRLRDPRDEPRALIWGMADDDHVRVVGGERRARCP